MTGITEIGVLLKEMQPVLDHTEYVFVTKLCFTLTDEILNLQPIATFLESEGVTLVITREVAENHRLSFDAIYKKITLEVHSSLEAVGLTAAISTALASCAIPANIISGYYHDHVFVPEDKAELALATLEELAK